jgi:hypothetical protein
MSFIRSSPIWEVFLFILCHVRFDDQALLLKEEIYASRLSRNTRINKTALIPGLSEYFSGMGKKGSRARAKKLTAEERKQIASGRGWCTAPPLCPARLGRGA